MIGEDKPLGAEDFHFTFLSGPNSTGGFWPSATPEPSGPRNRGQTRDFSALKPFIANAPISNSAISFLIIQLRGGWWNIIWISYSYSTLLIGAVFHMRYSSHSWRLNLHRTTDNPM